MDGGKPYLFLRIVQGKPVHSSNQIKAKVLGCVGLCPFRERRPAPDPVITVSECDSMNITGQARAVD